MVFAVMSLAVACDTPSGDQNNDTVAGADNGTVTPDTGKTDSGQPVDSSPPDDSGGELCSGEEELYSYEIWDDHAGDRGLGGFVMLDYCVSQELYELLTVTLPGIWVQTDPPLDRMGREWEPFELTVKPVEADFELRAQATCPNADFYLEGGDFSLCIEDDMSLNLCTDRQACQGVFNGYVEADTVQFFKSTEISLTYEFCTSTCNTRSYKKL
ncbi:hypothetical protein A2300_03335 [Candidatus Falkowbacteria bacterium RIFOXYB2_FULL_35_7]|nr:MAG: hypothetical protein A2300_03335 [Candidatus Falkowbacteria bacterium RIFOXYB2_FULL_35_7]